MEFPQSDHYDGKRFFNPWLPKNHHFIKFVKWQLIRTKHRWPRWIGNKSYLPVPKSIHNPAIAITFINHATFLIQTHTLNILTDPIFSMRASPVAFAGPKRVREPGISIENLPRIDIILLSHNHYDHLDIPSIERSYQTSSPKIYTGLGVGKHLKKYGLTDFKELDWWDTIKHKNADLTYIPAQHFSSRSFLDGDKTLWGGFVMETYEKKVLFAGDTGYAPHFKEIQKKWNSFDVALLPIGAYQPRWFMSPMHMCPFDAVQAHKDLNAKQSYGMHFGTFQLSDEPYDKPFIDLQKALRENPDLNFTILDHGETKLIE